MPDTTIVSFILRFTQEAPPGGASPSPTWRGMLRHVQTNEQINFVCLDEALEFIGRFVDLESGEALETNEGA
ncbi:MAG: hypothetical protein ACP5GX_02650 [Anaerolineae bacterium]